MDERHEAQIVEAHNAGYTSTSALEIRLKTENLLLELREKLEGAVISVVRDKEGNAKIIKEQFGKPLMNEEGIHAIMFFLTSVINTATVQGNFQTKEEWLEFIVPNLRELNYLLAANAREWNVKPEHHTLLYRPCASLIEMFTTRLIGNKEREGYAATFKTNENVSSVKKGLFG